MKTSFKTYTVLCAAVACIISLTSCGNDSSNNATNTISSSSNKTSSSSNNNKGRQKITYDTLALSVNERSNILSISNNGTSTEYCVAEGNSFKWKTIKSKPASSKMKYMFIGDTLVLYEWLQDSEDFEPYGSMLVGGQGGNIYGTWTLTPCSYNKKEKETFCFEDEEKGLIHSSFTISRKTFARAIASIHINQTLNYPTTSFRDVLNYTISEGPGYIPTANNLFHESYNDIDENTTFTGITTKDISASGETLNAGGKTIIVNVEKFSDDDNNWIAALTVSVDDKTCRNEYERYFDMTKNLCDAKYSEHYDLSKKTDKDGNEFQYVSLFRRNNNDEFTECLEPLIYPINESIDK